MSVDITQEQALALKIGLFEAVELAYPDELSRCYETLCRHLPVLIECDKELTPFFYKCIRDRLKRQSLQCIYLDGRPPPDADPSLLAMGMANLVLNQLRDVVRGAVDERIVVLPHLDLLTTSSGGLTNEAREMVALLYENPQILWLGFKDPSFSLPQVISNLFPQQIPILGLHRERLRYLITQTESRKFGHDFNPYQLYKYVSGLNVIRLRRLLSSLTGEDYPADPQPALDQLRAATLSSQLSLPETKLDDIGGYDKVKQRLQREILTLLKSKEQLSDNQAIQRLEALIPRGMIFWGPPGTGKTLFAKAMAATLGAAITVVSGPELKSRWVGESEERLRQIFVRARESAPAIIVFDELDSFATARGAYESSGVEHSMVNQLLTEMDGFRSDELVFVIGTTNFVESLDAALLRPGRFEFHLEIPYPNINDREQIIGIYNTKLNLNLSKAALAYMGQRTSEPVPGSNMPYSGDHIQALCRAIARWRLREQIKRKTNIDDIANVITEYQELPELTSAEERVIATHEAGHAVCALHCEHAPPIERISIQGDIGGALGFVRYADPAHRYVISHPQLLDMICILLAGREAENLFIKTLSIGAENDLQRATEMATALMTNYGYADNLYHCDSQSRLSEQAMLQLEQQVQALLSEQQQRAQTLLTQNKTSVQNLIDLLLKQKVLEKTALEVFGN